MCCVVCTPTSKIEGGHMEQGNQLCINVTSSRHAILQEKCMLFLRLPEYHFDGSLEVSIIKMIKATKG